MLILFRKLSTARAAEVNLLCLKVLFTPRGSSRCAGQHCGSVVRPRSPAGVPGGVLARDFLADTSSHQWKVAGVQWHDVRCTFKELFLQLFSVCLSWDSELKVEMTKTMLPYLARKHTIEMTVTFVLTLSWPRI